MPTVLVICCVAAVFAVAAWYFEHRHRSLEARMTQQVKERYAAYIELEERVRVALGEFESLESTFEAEIRKSRDQITKLEEALNSVEGIESVQVETPGGFLGVLDEGDANVQTQPVTLTGAPQDFEAELQKWERRVEAAQSEKCSEIERQRQQIAELTARVRQLDPSSSALRQRHEAQAHSGTSSGANFAVAPSDLDERIQKADASARELSLGLENFLRTTTGGIEGLRETLASCKPLLEQQVRDRAHAAELEQRRQELEQSSAKLEERCAELEERCSSLDTRLAERQRDLDNARSAVGELEARELGMTQKLENTSSELDGVRQELASEKSRLERETQAREELEEREMKLTQRLEATVKDLDGVRQELASEKARLESETETREELERSVAQLKQKLDDESKRGTTLVGELDGARARMALYEKECAALEGRGREQAEVLQAQTELLREREEEINRLRSRVSLLESKLVSTRDTIGGQKSRLVELMEAIQVTQKEQDRHKEILSEQSAHMQEARALLEQLRPVMDTLGGELDK